MERSLRGPPEASSSSAEEEGRERSRSPPPVGGQRAQQLLREWADPVRGWAPRPADPQWEEPRRCPWCNCWTDRLGQRLKHNDKSITAFQAVCSGLQRFPA
eukprot:14116021-Alexandrium_andersonii.AAC.1